MLALDSAILAEYAEHKDIVYSIEVTLKNGTKLTIDEDDLLPGGCNILRDNGADVMPLGYVYCSQITLSIFDRIKYQKVDFFNATAIVYGRYTHASGTLVFSLGTYTITEPTLTGSMIQLVGYDDIYKADKPCKISESMKATTLFEQCCYDCGINYDVNRTSGGVRAFPTGWRTNSIMIQTIPSGLSYRQVMGMVAMLFGANAYISPFDNYIYLLPLSVSGSSTILSYWGGLFDTETPYETGDIVDGGSFNPWNNGADADSGLFGSDLDILCLNDPLNTPAMSAVETTIGGVTTTINETEYSYGDGYKLLVENSLMDGQEQALIDVIGTAVRGVVFRTFELDYTSFPFADLMQRVLFVDRQGRANPSMITHLDIQLKGISRFKCTGESPDRVTAKDSYRSAYKTAVSNAIKAANEALTEARAELTAYDEEVQRLAKLIANSFGAFETEEVLADGSKIFYLHNKPSLANSTTIWKQTVDGFAVSTDGGRTWNAGMDSSGNMLVNILSTIGINFGWARGGILTLGGSGNVNGYLRILNASGTQIGYWDNTGIHASIGSFEGSIYSESGEIASFTIAGDSLYTESHSGVDSNSPGVYVGGAGVSCASSSSQKAVMRDGYIQLTTNVVNATSAGPTCGVYLKTTNEVYETHIAANMMIITYNNGVDELVETVFLADRTGIYTDGEKNRIVKTPDYSKRLMYCYETSAPMFGDVGEGEIGENGETRIYIDPVFAETISADGYQVFLQKYGIGECYISERNGAFFTVNGEPGLRFGWELKAKQFDLDQRRLDIFKQAADPETRDYGADAINHITEIEQERGISA